MRFFAYLVEFLVWIMICFAILGSFINDLIHWEPLLPLRRHFRLTFREFKSLIYCRLLNNHNKIKWLNGGVLRSSGKSNHLVCKLGNFQKYWRDSIKLICSANLIAKPHTSLTHIHQIWLNMINTHSFHQHKSSFIQAYHPNIHKTINLRRIK
jgi:hypothetical protein